MEEWTLLTKQNQMEMAVVNLNTLNGVMLLLIVGKNMKSYSRWITFSPFTSLQNLSREALLFFSFMLLLTLMKKEA